VPRRAGSPLHEHAEKVEALMAGSRARLFSSYHNYFDSSSGAALATRDLLEMLAARGTPCGVLCGAKADFERASEPAELLAAQGLSPEVRREPAGGFTVSARNGLSSPRRAALRGAHAGGRRPIPGAVQSRPGTIPARRPFDL